MCHNVVELVKSNTKYCCRQPDIVGDNIPAIYFFWKTPSRQPDIVGDNILDVPNFVVIQRGLCRQPDIVGDNFSISSSPLDKIIE